MRFFLISFWLIFSFSNFSQAATPALDAFNAGVTAHKKKDYQEATHYYNKVIRLKSKLAPVARYYKAKALIEMKKPSIALNNLKKIDTTKLPPKLKSRVIALKNSLIPDRFFEAEETEARFSGGALFGVGFNTNPQFISADDTTNESEGDLQYSFGLNLNYKMAIGESYDVAVDYVGTGRAYGQSSVSNYTYQTIAAPINFYTSKYRWQIRPGYSFQTFSGSPFSSIGSAGFEMKRKFDGSYLTVGVDYDSINNLNDDYFYLSGSSLRPYIQWHEFWQISHLYLYYEFQDNQYKDSSTVSPSYTSHNAIVTVSQSFDAWTWSTSLGIELRDYTFDVTENDTRDDQRFWTAINLSYLMNKQFSVFVNLFYNKNQSNFDQSFIEDKNYLQISGTTGLKMQF